MPPSGDVAHRYRPGGKYGLRSSRPKVDLGGRAGGATDRTRPERRAITHGRGPSEFRVLGVPRVTRRILSPPELCLLSAPVLYGQPTGRSEELHALQPREPCL